MPFIHLFLLGSLLGLALASDPPYQSDLWQADFIQLKKFLSDGYPNLEVYPLDFPQLSQKTQSALNAAKSNAEARLVLDAFLKEFKDGHLKIDEPRMSSSKKKELGFRFPTPQSLGFSEVQMVGGAFPLTTLNLGKGRVGFIRIASFLEKSYDNLTEQQLIQEFEKGIRYLQSQGIGALLLDLTFNGGGTDWVEAVIRILTPRPIVCGQFGFIRHDHWTKYFKEEIAETKDPLKLLELQEKLDATKIACDRTRIWKQKDFIPICSPIVKSPVVDCEPHSEYKYTKGLYHGALFVLMNDSTASASEELVGRYKDSKAATLIGTKTHGSGCGHTNGGIHWELPHSKLKIKIPDCARYLKDGTNEVLGIEPDIELPMKEIKTHSFTQSLVNLLRSKVHDQ